MAHGIMFHHFYGGPHPRGQGAISADDLDAMIAQLRRKHAVLSAERWLEVHAQGDLQPYDVCLTFDDGLRCQYDLALPVLKRHNLTAFWFIYTSVYDGETENMETYRYFRTTQYKTPERFYTAFYCACGLRLPRMPRGAELDGYLSEYPFYSAADRIFRYVRDEILGPTVYRAVMGEMMDAAGFDPYWAGHDLWMGLDQLRELSAGGHVLGLHSHTHPTRLAALPLDRQMQEYRHNKELLDHLGGRPVVSVAHPCNSYSVDTLEILRGLGIRVGFRSNMAQSGGGPLEFPRRDHTDVMKELQP